MKLQENNDLKKKLICCLTWNGEKHMMEKIILRMFKKLGEMSKIQIKNLLKTYFLFTLPVFKVNKKWARTIPVVLWNHNIRISLVIKLMLVFLKNKKSNSFYIKLYNEIYSNTIANSKVFVLKNEIQNQALLTKKFLFYYKWN